MLLQITYESENIKVLGWCSYGEPNHMIHECETELQMTGERTGVS